MLELFSKIGEKSNENIFFSSDFSEIFFWYESDDFKKKKFNGKMFDNFSKNFFDSYPKKLSSKSDEKKIWPHFSLFSYFNRPYLKNYLSMHNPSLWIIKSPLKIIKSKRLFLKGERVSRILSRKGPIFLVGKYPPPS